MKNAFVRWTVLILGGLVAAALIGAGLLAYLVSRLDVKAEIERAVENATGRELTITGDVGVSFWPVLGLQAADATLANVQGGRAPALAAMDRINVGVEIRPLFNRDVVVRQLVLQKPRISLEVDAQGRPNWILRPVTSPQRPPARPAPQPNGRTSQFSLREVRIADGEISFYDARRQTGWAVGEVNLKSALTSLNDPVRIEGDVKYNDHKLDLRVEVARPGAVFAGQPVGIVAEISSDLVIATFNGRTTAASGEVDGNLQASGPSLRQLAAWAGAPIQGGVGFEHFAVSGHVAVGGGQFNFSNAGFALDLIRGRGDFVLSQLRGKPYLSGRLELFDFDLNPYLSGQQPPAAAAAQIAAPTGAQTASAPAPSAQIAAVQAPARALDVQAAPTARPMDFSGLHAINADLELVTAAVLVQHMRIDSARLNLVVNDGYLAATLQNMSLYGGSGRGRFEIDAREPAARMVQDMTFSGIDTRRFLTDAVNFSNIEGRGEITIVLNSQGRTQSEFISSADGRMHVEVVSGALHGIDLGGVATTIRNAMRGELIAPEARTPLTGFSATFDIADGVLASDDISFNTPDLRAPGVGTIDLVQNRLDLRLAPRSQRGGIVFPFVIRGPFAHLTYDSDIRDRAKREIEARVRSVKTSSRTQRAAAR